MMTRRMNVANRATVLTDLKYYGLRRARDQRFDDIATGLAWFVATALVIFYGLGATP